MLVFRRQSISLQVTREYKNAYSILATSPNAERLKTNHLNISTRFSLSMEMSRLTWDGIAEPLGTNADM